MALFKPHMLPLRSVRSLSTMLGLVLNFYQAVFLQRRSEGSADEDTNTRDASFTYMVCVLTWYVVEVEARRA